MAKLYQPYLDHLQDVLNLQSVTETRQYPPINGLPEREVLQRINKGLLKLDEQQTALQQVADLFGIKSYQRPKLVPHPDFEHLRNAENMTEEHYIVSMFIDVRRSTAMFKRLSKEQIHGVVNIVNRVTTHTMALFGSHHIQRIMFDGTFCYFGGRNIPKEQAVMDAINAATMFCYFMEWELPSYFEQYGLEKVNTRIGIDFGDTSDVLWGLHGTVDCGELSTTSLHTSLAAKMQCNAAPNGIVVGQYMVDRMADEARPFCDKFRDAKGNVDESKRYIFRSENLNYSQYEFNWDSYLKETKKNIAKLLPDGTLLTIPPLVSPKQSDKLAQLGEKIRLMETGNGHITPQGQVTAKPTGIVVPKNSFYSDDK